jgi:hypothetical protein
VVEVGRIEDRRSIARDRKRRVGVGEGPEIGRRQFLASTKHSRCFLRAKP